MQPKTNNNPPPTSASDGYVGDANASGEGAVNSVVNFPDGLDEGAIARYCGTRNAAWDAWAPDKMQKIQDAHRVFRNQPIHGEKQTFPLPIGPGIIESINARLQSTLLNKPKAVEAVSEEPETDNETRDKVESFVNQQLLEETRRPEKGKAGIKSAIIEGVLIWRNLWKQVPYSKPVPVQIPDPAWIRTPEAPEPALITVGEQVIEGVKEFWTWELKSIADVAWDPNVTTRVRDSEWFRERSRMSYNQLLRWQQEGRIQGVERLRYVVPSGASSKTKEDWAAALKKADGDAYWPVTYADERAYKIEEWYARITWQNGEQVEMGDFHFFLCEDRYVLNFERNPLLPVRHPYDSCPLIILPNSPIGLSVLEQIAALQRMVNTFSGYQAQLGERAAKPLILFDASSGMSARAAFMKMYGYQAVDNINGIKEVPTDAAPIQIVQQYVQFLMTLARETSGANEQFQGVEGSDTATEFQGLMAAAGSRFADIADTLAQGWIEALANECRLFYAQFGVDGQMVVRKGVEGIAQPITRAELGQEYTFQAVAGANEQAKALEVENAMKAVELGVKLGPSPEGRVFNAEKAFTDIILPNLGQKNGQDWFVQMPMAPGPMMGPTPPGGLPPMPPSGDMLAGPGLGEMP